MIVTTSPWKKCVVITMAMGATFSMGAAQYPDAGSAFGIEAVSANQEALEQTERILTDEEASEGEEKTEEKVEVKVFEVPENARFLENRSLKSGREAKVYEEIIDHPVREIDDEKIPQGTTVVVKEGSDGLTEHIDVVGSSSGYSKKITSPVEEVVRIGTGTENEKADLIDRSLVVLWEEKAEEERQAVLAAEIEAAAEQDAAEEAEREERAAQREADARLAEQEEAEREAADSSPSESRSSTNTASRSTASSEDDNDGYRNAPRAGVSCGGWGDLIEEYFGAAQYDKACSVMMCESRGDAKAQNPVSTASGLYQFLDTTWYSARGAVGGGEYARAMDAPAEMQIEAAAKWQQRTNWGQWVCQ